MSDADDKLLAQVFRRYLDDGMNWADLLTPELLVLDGDVSVSPEERAAVSRARHIEGAEELE